MSYNFLAKDRLLANIDAEIERLEMSGRVNDQMTVMKLRDDREIISNLNRVEAYRTEKAIEKVEAYDPAADKHGFGPVTVNPINYVGFIER